MAQRNTAKLFKDEERAVEVLANISYFRIANYLRYFEIDNDRHLYKPDTYFEDAVYIYYFDKKLRSLLFTAIQSIEISLRSKVIHHVALSHGPFWFADSNLCINRAMFADNLTTIKRGVAFKRGFHPRTFQEILNSATL